MSAFRFLKISIPFLWLGFVVAISFMETPLKFQAPGIDIKLGLGIGRIVFYTLNKIELVFLVLLFISWFYNKGSRAGQILLFSLAAILFAETFWLLPALDERAIMILSDIDPGPSALHTTYIVLEFCKVLLLGITGYINIRHEQASTLRN